MEDTTKTEVPVATDKPKLLKANNEWNVEGLREARSENDGEEVLCTKTEKPLYYVRDNGYKTMLDSFGFCINCEDVFHVSHLKFSDSVAKSPWPIEYIGSWCLECAKLDPSEWAENFIPMVKEVGIEEFEGEIPEDELEELEEEYIEALDDEDDE
jgi:hypothetical protein